MRYVKGKEAAEILGISQNTLRKLADDGRINTIRISGQRRYNVDAFLGSGGTFETICYCRVSSYKQKDDLDRQVAYLRERYPNAEFVRDIGSGINFKRKGLKTILERAMRGHRITLVVAHRDRLARFGCELIKQIIEFHGGKLLVLSEDSLSPEQELTRDLLNIIHVFSCRMHGLRKYKEQLNQTLSDASAEKNL